MKTLGKIACAALLSAAPPFVVPALAAAMHDNTTSDTTHPTMLAQVTCKDAGMSDTGMMVEFHNMGSDPIPAGTKVHWKLRGMAQGDMHFKDALAPGGMESQNYMMHDTATAAGASGDSTHMAGHPMPSHAPCSVEMM